MDPRVATLDQMHDVIAPPATPWWPPAPGWIWLGSVLLIVLIGCAITLLIHWQKNRYRREALRELDHAVRLGDPNKILATAAELLKRTALSRWPRSEVASLTGPRWFEFLDRTGQSSLFSKEIGAAVESAAYSSVATTSPDRLEIILRECRHWIRHHH